MLGIMFPLFSWYVHDHVQSLTACYCVTHNHVTTVKRSCELLTLVISLLFFFFFNHWRHYVTTGSLKLQKELSSLKSWGGVLNGWCCHTSEGRITDSPCFMLSCKNPVCLICTREWTVGSEGSVVTCTSRAQGNLVYAVNYFTNLLTPTVTKVIIYLLLNDLS